MDSSIVSKRPISTQSPLKNDTTKTNKILSVGALEPKEKYDRSWADTNINIGHSKTHGGNFSWIQD